MESKIKDFIGIILAILFIIAFFTLAFGWAWYQFHLCYPDVSKSILYCLQHAL